MATPEDPSPVPPPAETGDPAPPSPADERVTVHYCGLPSQRRDPGEIQSHDFRDPSFLSQAELRRLRLRSEGFVRALSARLSLYLRMDCSVQMSGMQALSYRKFVDGLGESTHLSLFRAEPLPGICILEMPPQLGLAIVDRLLGGAATGVETQHEFTEIELALLEQAVRVIVAEWCSDWKGLMELRPVVLGHETSGRFLQFPPHDTVMLRLSMEVRIGGCAAIVQVGFPSRTVEPLILALNAASEVSGGDKAPSPPSKPRWNPMFDTVRVPVSAAWQDIELTAREITGLKLGDVLELPVAGAEQILVRLGDSPRFRGRLGTCGNHWAVQVIEGIKR